MDQPAPRLRFWISVLLSSAMLAVLTGPSLPLSAQAGAQGQTTSAPQGRGGGGGRGEAPPAIPALPPIDRQVVRDQDDMTWAADYKPIPGVNWAEDRRAPSERTIKIAMVLFDFEDQPFVVTLPKHSDPFGNPQIDSIKREDAAALHPDDAARFLNADVYRISVSVQGAGWAAQIQNALAAVPFGGTQTVPVFVSKTAGAADSAVVTLRAASESDPTKKAVITYVVKK